MANRHFGRRRELNGRIGWYVSSNTVIPLRWSVFRDRVQAERLVQFDHHQVIVQGCWGILFTYPWMPLDEVPEPLVATVVFNPAPRHAPTEDVVRMIIRKHPVASQEIQAIINQWVFHQ